MTGHPGETAIAITDTYTVLTIIFTEDLPSCQMLLS
jgi:hypothetical protein